MNNDRFKFRVWNKKHNFYCDQNGDMVISSSGHCFDNGIRGDYSETDGFIVEQCTGLKDKNGNLIYEGDVVLAKHSHKSRPEKFIVKWGQGVFHIITAGFWLFNFSPITLETAKKGDDFPESSEIEIIGNIHEHKETTNDK